MRKGKSRWLLICFTLLCVNLLLIWGNSALSGEDSAELSGGLLEWLQRVFPVLKNLEHTVLRKLGHYAEFTCLGLLAGWMIRLLGKPGTRLAAYPLLFGIIAACLDETIQLYVPERHSVVLDVWIDAAGVCSGVILLNLGYYILGKRRNKQEEI